MQLVDEGSSGVDGADASDEVNKPKVVPTRNVDDSSPEENSTSAGSDSGERIVERESFILSTMPPFDEALTITIAPSRRLFLHRADATTASTTTTSTSTTTVQANQTATTHNVTASTTGSTTTTTATTTVHANETESTSTTVTPSPTVNHGIQPRTDGNNGTLEKNITFSVKFDFIEN